MCNTRIQQLNLFLDFFGGNLNSAHYLTPFKIRFSDLKSFLFSLNMLYLHKQFLFLMLTKLWCLFCFLQRPGKWPCVADEQQHQQSSQSGEFINSNKIKFCVQKFTNHLHVCVACLSWFNEHECWNFRETLKNTPFWSLPNSSKVLLVRR